MGRCHVVKPVGGNKVSITNMGTLKLLIPQANKDGGVSIATKSLASYPNYKKISESQIFIEVNSLEYHPQNTDPTLVATFSKSYDSATGLLTVQTDQHTETTSQNAEKSVSVTVYIVE